MKFYFPTENYEFKSQQYVERNTDTSFHDLKLKIKKLNTDYSHKDIDKKILLANSLLRNLLRTDNGFTLLDSVKKSQKNIV